MKNYLRVLGIITFLMIQLSASRTAHASPQSHGDHPGHILPLSEYRPYANANPHPTGTDPLTAAELAQAQYVAANTPLLGAAQFVYAERQDAKKTASLTPRRADVIFYNYATDQVIRQVVNLETDRVEATYTLPGQNHQPPVAITEAEAAVQMILAHPILSQELQQAFLQATGEFLLRADQVQPQGILFVPSDAANTRLADVTRACAQHRCIQLFLQTQYGMIDASNLVVDLSAGQLLWADAPFKAWVFEDKTASRNPSPNNTYAEDFVCATGQPIVMTMTIGSRWGLCWMHDPATGLVLNQISFAPNNGEMTLILGSAALAQVVVAYDDGLTQRHVLSEGGLPLSALTTADCPQGTLLRDAAGAVVACQSLQPRGYAWRGTDQVQGQRFALFGVSRAGGDTWTHQWVFDDDGAMHPMLGVSGQREAMRLSKDNNRSITAYWRLNFDIGGSANDAVEQFDYVADSANPITRTQTSVQFTRETSSTLSPAVQRFWRIKDTKMTNSAGRNISYQIVPQLTSVYRSSAGFTRSDVFVTNHKACEQFASHNPATAGGCATQVSDFVNGEALDDPTSDVVVWYGATRHLVLAKEDELLVRNHWQGFTLLPRDFMNTSPLLPSQPSAAPPQALLTAPVSSTLNCSSPYQITQRFASAAQWEMCWEPRAGYGYRLNQITFTPVQGRPRLILNTLHVALMFVPYDDGGPRYRDTSLGQQLAMLTTAECPNGVLLPGDTLCLMRHAHNSAEGEGFEVFGYFNVANYYYVIRFAFNADGSIVPSVGASGSLQRFTRDAATGWPIRGLVATNHNHWVIWRMDFDLDGAEGDQVKQFDALPGVGDSRSLSATLLLTETQTQNDLHQSRFWRVFGDASPMALTYEIEPSVTDIYRADESFTQNDFYLTQNHADEALVSDAFGLNGFVNGEHLQDVVAWYGVNFHHVPRSEEDVRMPIHWQGFVLRLQDRGLASRTFMPLMMR